MDTDNLILEDIDLGGLVVSVQRPREPEELIDEVRFELDEFLPYWAELWPAGTALASYLAGAPDMTGAHVLELGCGLGLPSLVAALRGGLVTATDWAPEAVELLRANAVRNGVHVEALEARWDEPVSFAGRPPVDLLLAADVLYERRNASELCALVPFLLRENGWLLIADPGRSGANRFFEQMADDGWETHVVAEPGDGLLRSTVWRLRRPVGHPAR